MDQKLHLSLSHPSHVASRHSSHPSSHLIITIPSPHETAIPIHRVLYSLHSFTSIDIIEASLKPYPDKAKCKMRRMEIKLDLTSCRNHHTFSSGSVAEVVYLFVHCS